MLAGGLLAPTLKAPNFLKMEDELLPPSFESPCIRDVTSEFIPTTDAEIKLTGEITGHNLCWFSVFIQGKWIPVGWGVVDKNRNTVLFRDILKLVRAKLRLSYEDKALKFSGIEKGSIKILLKQARETYIGAD